MVWPQVSSSGGNEILESFYPRDKENVLFPNTMILNCTRNMLAKTQIISLERYQCTACLRLELN